MVFRVARRWKAGVVAMPLRFASLRLGYLRLGCVRVGSLFLVAICAAALAGCATQQTIAGSGPKSTARVATQKVSTSKAATSKTLAHNGTISARSTFARPVPSRTRFARHRATTGASIPLPDTALLEPQSAPDCEYRGRPTGNAGEDARVRLDYQQQCYRQAEGIVRTRLDNLQESVGETIRAVKRR